MSNGDDNALQDFIINEYTFFSQEHDLHEIQYSVDGAMAHGEHIVLWNTGFSRVGVTKLSSDGSIFAETNIQMSHNPLQVLGLNITNDELYEIIFTELKPGGDIVIHYGLYNQQGGEISTKVLVDNVARSDESNNAGQAVFADDGNIAIVLQNGSDRSTLYLFSDGEIVKQSILSSNQCIVRLKSGKLALSQQDDTNTLREFDFSTGDWGEEYSLAVSNVQRMFQTDSLQANDLLIDDGTYLIGYALESNTQNRFINLLEIGITGTQVYYCGLLPDGSIFLLYSERLDNRGLASWSNKLIILSLTYNPNPNPTEQRTIITIGGRWYAEGIQHEVIKYNNENGEYIIELIDYFSDSISREAGELRFFTDMITGRGPDIIVDAGHNLINQEYLADLNVFIDNDPELSRSDFFQNILSSLETPDGKLPLITNAFYIWTMLARRDNTEKLEHFTFDSLLLRLDELDALALAGNYMSRERFIRNAIQFSGNDFIDWDNNKANLDSDAFIAMLDIASRLPEQKDARITISEDNNLRHLFNGRQLLHEYTLMRPEDYYFMQAKARNSFVAIGMPTTSGGQNIVQPVEGIGINIGSQNKEAAWDFVRRFLLPDGSPFFGGIPLRIDKYEEIITELMTPVFWEFTLPSIGAVTGEEQFKRFLFNGEEIDVYAMTAEDAVEIRGFIESATIRHRIDNALMAIIEEDSQNFFNGIRTAADTARIMQNRVQTYLNEKG